MAFYISTKAPLTPKGSILPSFDIGSHAVLYDAVRISRIAATMDEFADVIAKHSVKISRTGFCKASLVPVWHISNDSEGFLYQAIRDSRVESTMDEFADVIAKHSVMPYSGIIIHGGPK